MCACAVFCREENWEFFLKMHLQWRYDYLEEKFNPHDGKTYKYCLSLSQYTHTHRDGQSMCLVSDVYLFIICVV